MAEMPDATPRLQQSLRSPPRTTTVPLAFFTAYMDATSEPTFEPVPGSRSTAHSPVHFRNTQTEVAVVAPELAPAGFDSSATTDNSRAAQLVIDNPGDASTSTSACFLGIPIELRYTIYGYLWAPNVDVFIDPRNPLHPNGVHPIFHINSQTRLEAIDSIRKDQMPTVRFHINAEDLDLRKTTSVLKKLDFKYLKTSNDREVVLRVHINTPNVALSEPFMHAYYRPVPRGSLTDFIACLSKLGLQAEYEYTRLDLGSPMVDSEYTHIDRDGILAKRIRWARAKLAVTFCRSIKIPEQDASPDSARAMKAAHEMQVFVRGFCLNTLF